MGFRRKFKASPLGAQVADAQELGRRAGSVPPPPELVVEHGPDGEQLTFRGGWTLPAGGGRAARSRLGKELGELRIEDGLLTLRPLRQPHGRFVADVHLTADDVRLASPIDLNYVGSNRGVALRLDDGAGYLWTDQPADVLARLADEGFSTDSTPVVSRGIIG